MAKQTEFPKHKRVVLLIQEQKYYYEDKPKEKIPLDNNETETLLVQQAAKQIHLTYQ